MSIDLVAKETFVLLGLAIVVGVGSSLHSRLERLLSSSFAEMGRQFDMSLIVLHVRVLPFAIMAIVHATSLISGTFSSTGILENFTLSDLPKLLQCIKILVR